MLLLKSAALSLKPEKPKFSSRFVVRRRVGGMIMCLEKNGRFAMRTEAKMEIVPSALALDFNKFKPDLHEFELTEIQQTELLRTLFEILRSLVDLNFELDVVARVFGEEENR
jgi:hypothetical protein